MASAAADSDRRKYGYVKMIILIMTAVLVVALIVFVILYSYEPYTAKFAVTNASLTEYNFSTNNSSSNLHYDLDLNVTVRNGNKKYGIFYDNLQIMAYYKKNHHMLGTENLTSFYQGKKNTTHLTLSLKLGQLRLDHVLSNNDGAISYHDIDVKLHVRNRYKAKYTRKGNSNITCHLEVPLISSRDNGSQSANTNTSTSNFNTTWCNYSTGQNFSGFPMAIIILCLGIYCVFYILFSLFSC